MEKIQDCLELPTGELPFPEQWIVDDATQRTSFDQAEAVRIYNLIVWAQKQIARCKAGAHENAHTP